jgi:hypothetical protein
MVGDILEVISFRELLPTLAKRCLRPWHWASRGGLIVEVRFVLASSPHQYVQVYGQCTSNKRLASFLAALYQYALRHIYRDLLGNGRFESTITPREICNPYHPFWNPDLARRAMTSKGKMHFRNVTTREIVPEDSEEDRQGRAARRLKYQARARARVTR